MPIIHSIKTIFIHIPKAGGTSIETVLCDFPLFRYQLVNKYNWYGNIKNDETKYELDHSTMAYLKRNCKYYDNSYFSFAIVRNPYARLVSEYHYCKYQYSRFIKKLDSFKDFVYELKDKFDYVLKNKEKDHLYVSHYLPQYLFTHNYRKVKIVNKIYKLENLNEEWTDICEILDIDKELVRTEKNASKFKYNYEDYYDDELKSIVYEMYKDDFEVFNYEK
tara:strand:+ start:10001 stop:10660 length:660 start_codon:yes stop_codon:yes gene_type:complete